MNYKTEFELCHLETHQANLGDESVDLGMSKHILLVHPPEVLRFYLFFFTNHIRLIDPIVKRIYQQDNLADQSNIYLLGKQFLV